MNEITISITMLTKAGLEFKFAYDVIHLLKNMGGVESLQENKAGIEEVIQEWRNYNSETIQLIWQAIANIRIDLIITPKLVATIPNFPQRCVRVFSRLFANKNLLDVIEDIEYMEERMQQASIPTEDIKLIMSAIIELMTDAIKRLD